MKRTTVFLDEALLRRARDTARREGKSFAAVVREAVAAYVSGARPRARRLPSIVGKYRSEFTDTSERVDELLWKDPHA
jgi:hypothetical protein